MRRLLMFRVMREKEYRIQEKEEYGRIKLLMIKEV